MYEVLCSYLLSCFVVLLVLVVGRAHWLQVALTVTLALAAATASPSSPAPGTLLQQHHTVVAKAVFTESAVKTVFVSPAWEVGAASSGDTPTWFIWSQSDRRVSSGRLTVRALRTVLTANSCKQHVFGVESCGLCVLSL
jgi:hypothetical protein